MEITTIAQWDAGYPYSEYKVDLSSYKGQEIYLGFRHFTQVGNFALGIDNITVTNAVWSGTASVTDHYNIYCSDNGQNYHLIGVADGDHTTYHDHAKTEQRYYQVTAVNTVVGGETCESAPAMSIDGIHDYVMVVTDGVEESLQEVSVYPNPTTGLLKVTAEGLKHITVMNTLGQVVYDAALEGNEAILDLSRCHDGVYMLRIETLEAVLVKRVTLSR